MLNVWLGGLVLVPLLSSLGLLGRARRARAVTGWHVALSVSALVTLCALALTFYPEQDVPFRLVWLPDVGVLTFSLATSGRYAALATSGAAFLALLICKRTDIPPPAVAGLLLLILAVTNTAFLSAHFLGRYVALEIVGLCIALVPLFTSPEALGSRKAAFVYLLLRVGDSGFLIAMLMLLNATATLDIAPALEAAVALSPSRLAWITAGFVLAAWVKIGAWPFTSWQQVGAQLDLTSHGWTYATVMPNLGLYLLYRITPLLSRQPSLQGWVVWLSLGGMIMLSIFMGLERDRRAMDEYLWAVQGGLALTLAAGGQKTLVWLLVPLLTPLRLLFLWGGSAVRVASPHLRRLAKGLVGAGSLLLMLFDLYLVWEMARGTSLSPVALSLLVLVVVLTGGRYLFGVIGRSVPRRLPIAARGAGAEIPPHGIASSRRRFDLVDRLRAWLEEDSPERMIRGIASIFSGGAGWLYRTVERRGLENGLRGITGGVFALGRWLRQRHTGRLRANLQWVLLVLLALIALLVGRGW